MQGDSLVIQLSVGDTAPLVIESANTFGVDCTSAVDTVRWAYTTAGVVEFSPVDAIRTILTAANQGETKIFADLRFKTGQTKRAEPFVFSNVWSGRPSIRVVAR